MEAVVLALSLLTSTYYWVAYKGQQGLYRHLEQVPHRQTALLLGTNPVAAGSINLYYLYRIDAAEALWKAGKFDKIIVSGSRRMTKEGLYDEIAAMRADLIKRGIPADRILDDPDSHRTLLSIQRADSVFGLSDYLLISQAFHCERSLFIARDLGQNPICYAAADVPGRPLMVGRELISRLIAVGEAFR